MSTDMRGIFQSSLFSKAVTISVAVPDTNRYRLLSDAVPWPEAAELANQYRALKADIHNGRNLDLRLHLGAFIAQAMNGWTDRETEDMVRYHAGVRILCGCKESTASLDRTSIEAFRNVLSKEGAQELNRLMVRSAAKLGFTGSELCSSDTTVQEAPIAHPTEVGHMKKIIEKLSGIASGIASGFSTSAKKAAFEIVAAGRKIFTQIRLSTRGKSEKAIAAKKKLGANLHETAVKLLCYVEGELSSASTKAKIKARAKLDLFTLMLSQIDVWHKTGFHPKDKILSLWATTARAIARGKAAKTVEFGRRWIVTRLTGGYIIGAPCEKLGGGSDTSIADEVILDFAKTFRKAPITFVYDRGGDGPFNHALLLNIGVKNNCIFGREGSDRLPLKVAELGRRERALSEASIANIKHDRYRFNKPRARSTESCALKGFAAICGFNLNNLVRDLTTSLNMTPEIS